MLTQQHFLGLAGFEPVTRVAILKAATYQLRYKPTQFLVSIMRGSNSLLATISNSIPFNMEINKPLRNFI